MPASLNIVTTNASITTSASMEINNGTATLILPDVNPTGASVDVPMGLSKTSDNGPMVWSPIAGGVTSLDFNAMGLYQIKTAGTTTITLASMFPGLPSPYSSNLLLEVTLVGGGGGGSSTYNPAVTTSTAGGGGGATAIHYLRDVTPTTSFTFTVGAAGAGAPGGNSTPNTIGRNGSPTLMNIAGVIIGAEGGEGAGFGATTSQDVRFQCHGGDGGLSGVPSGATTLPNIFQTGGSGGTGSTAGLISAGCGGSSSQGGSILGPIQFVTATNYQGYNGQGYGCGGSGCVINQNSTISVAGGAGANGIVIAKLFYNS